MANFNAIFLCPELKELSKEILEWKDTVLSNNLIFGRKAFDDLAVKYHKEKTVWVFTKNERLTGWIQSNYKDRDWINIITNPADLPDALSYTVCGGAEIFALFADKIKESYVIGDCAHPFKGKEEIVLTFEGISVKKIV